MYYREESRVTYILYDTTSPLVENQHTKKYKFSNTWQVERLI